MMMTMMIDDGCRTLKKKT